MKRELLHQKRIEIIQHIDSILPDNHGQGPIDPGATPKVGRHGNSYGHAYTVIERALHGTCIDISYSYTGQPIFARRSEKPCFGCVLYCRSTATCDASFPVSPMYRHPYEPPLRLSRSTSTRNGRKEQVSQKELMDFVYAIHDSRAQLNLPQQFQHKLLAPCIETQSGVTAGRREEYRCNSCELAGKCKFVKK